MDDLHEIVDAAAVGRLFTLLAILGPAIGLLIGAVLGARSGKARPGAMRGLAIGLVLTLNAVMWRIYNGITDRLGLDTVKNVLVNFALFAIVGIVVGVGAGRILSRRPARNENETTAAVEQQREPSSQL